MRLPERPGAPGDNLIDHWKMIKLAVLEFAWRPFENYLASARRLDDCDYIGSAHWRVRLRTRRATRGEMNR